MSGPRKPLVAVPRRALLLGAAVGLAWIAPACRKATSSGEPGGTLPGPPAADFRPMTSDEVRIAVAPRLRGGEKLAHQAFRGPLGARGDGALAVVVLRGYVAGFVLVPGPGRKTQRMDLPPLSQGLLDKVSGIVFADADGKPGKEAIIMTTQVPRTRPKEASAKPGPRAFNLVIAWNGSAFVRLREVEEALADLDSEAAVRKALAALPARPK